MKAAATIFLLLVSSLALAQAQRGTVLPSPVPAAPHQVDLSALQQQLAELKAKQASQDQVIAKIRLCNKLLQTKLYMLTEGVAKKSDNYVESSQAIPTPQCENSP